MNFWKADGTTSVWIAMPNGQPIKDPMFTSKMLEARKAKANLLPHTSSAPSLQSMQISKKLSRPQTQANLMPPQRERSPNVSHHWKIGGRSRKSSYDSGSSESGSSAASTPSVLTINNVDVLANKVAALEVELRAKTERLENATERLSDRELEISILQKRLELRSSSKSYQAPDCCYGCSRKDNLISCLFEKVNLYESAILGVTASSESTKPVDVSNWDLDVILRNVAELNKLVAENERTVEFVDNGAKFNPKDVMHLSFFADGFQLDQGRFRSYSEKATKAFMKDLSDGFFPSELQGTFPNGVTFMVSDQRTTSKRRRSPRLGPGQMAFQGVGHRLADFERPNSAKGSSSTLPPLLSVSPKKSKSVADLSKAANLQNKVKRALTRSSSREVHKCSSTNATEKCYLKVHGIGDAPFLLELVAYDTIKTVRGLMGNVLRSEYIKLNRDHSTSTAANNGKAVEDFKLYTGFPRRILSDDSKSLGDLGLVPNGVLHLVRNTAI